MATCLFLWRLLHTCMKQEGHSDSLTSKGERLRLSKTQREGLGIVWYDVPHCRGARLPRPDPVLLLPPSVLLIGKHPIHPSFSISLYVRRSSLRALTSRPYSIARIKYLPSSRRRLNTLLVVYRDGSTRQGGVAVPTAPSAPSRFKRTVTVEVACLSVSYSVLPGDRVSCAHTTEFPMLIRL